jgi:glutathione S-transferase
MGPGTFVRPFFGWLARALSARLTLQFFTSGREAFALKLHHNPASPFVRMVMVLAHELDIAEQIETIDTGLFLPDRVNDAVAADNPLGKIPALITDHGTVLYDSRVICEYLCHHAGNKELLPDEPVSRFRILTMQSLAIGLMDAGVSRRYETAVRPEEKRWPEWVARQHSRMEAGLDELENNWAGELDTVNAGSIATAAVLAYFDFRFEDLGWRDTRSKLAAFYEGFSARPSMTQTQPPA